MAYDTYGNIANSEVIHFTINNNIDQEVIGISGGYYHTVAVKADGTVWAWAAMKMVRLVTVQHLHGQLLFR